jgi:chromosome partitioning protein
MGSILTVATSKGGAGKTTLTASLAAYLARQQRSVAVVDADPNCGFSSWHAQAYEGVTLTVSAESRSVEVVDHAQAEADRHDVVLLDTAGFQNLTAAAAITVADFVLIPAMPDAGSVVEAIKTVQQAGSLGRAARRTIPCSVVLVRWDGRLRAHRAARADLLDAGVPVLTHVLPPSTQFEAATFTGRLPTTGPVEIAIAEIAAELATLQALPAFAAAELSVASDMT